MSRTIWFLLLISPLILVLGCGRKAPPTLPAKPASLVFNLETGEPNLYKEEAVLLEDG
jgi:hypothetical protein